MPIFVIPEIRPYEYEDLRAMVSDLPPTYDGWLAVQDMVIRDAEAGGDTTRFLAVDPTMFAQYLRERGQMGSVAGMCEFVAQRVRGAS